MEKEGLKPDIILKDYWRVNDRFADLFNQVFFQGSPVISPDKLIEQDTSDSTTVIKNDSAEAVTKYRDVIKKYIDGAELVLVSIENQQKVHYAMPIRSLMYDALQYEKQCKALEQEHRKKGNLKTSEEYLSGVKKEDRLNFVLTLVICYAKDKWEGAVSLGDMVNVPEIFKPYFNDYKIHLIKVNEASKLLFKNKDNEEFFRTLDTLYQYNRITKKAVKESYADEEVSWDVMAAIGAVTGSKNLMQYAWDNKGGRNKMSTIWEDIIKVEKEEIMEEQEKLRKEDQAKLKKEEKLRKEEEKLRKEEEKLRKEEEKLRKEQEEFFDFLKNLSNEGKHEEVAKCLNDKNYFQILLKEYKSK